jgi:hypothetical protein
VLKCFSHGVIVPQEDTSIHYELVGLCYSVLTDQPIDLNYTSARSSTAIESLSPLRLN